jgi:transposase
VEYHQARRTPVLRTPISAVSWQGSVRAATIMVRTWRALVDPACPANITIIPLPPKCPELNPVENVWQFMRDNWLSNRIFKSYDDLVDHCCAAWNKLVDQPWRIMSIGLRQWARGF